MALIKRMFYFDMYIGHAVADIKVDVKPWFHVKIKLFFKNLGLHRTTSEMKENYLVAFSSVLAQCIVFMSLFLLHVLGYFDFFVLFFSQ